MRALELQKQEEMEDNANLKIRIMEQATLMLYDDDFDEDDIYATKPQTQKYKAIVVQKSSRPKSNSQTPKKEEEQKEEFDGISSIGNKNN